MSSLKKIRFPRQFDDFELNARTTTGTPNLLSKICSRADLRGNEIPFINQRSARCTRSPLKPEITTVQRALVNEFLTDKKLDRFKNPSKSRDISHLRDSSMKNLKENPGSSSVFVISSEPILFPASANELSQLGQSTYSIFPKIFNDSLANQTISIIFTQDSRQKSIPNRQDTKNLRTWYELMKKKYFSDPSRLNESKGVMIIAIREFYSQVSFNCHERGEIFLDLFQAYAKIVNNYIEALERKHMERISAEAQRSTEIINALKDKVRNIKKKLKDAEQVNYTMLCSEAKLIERIKVLETEAEVKAKAEFGGFRKRTSVMIKRLSVLGELESIVRAQKTLAEEIDEKREDSQVLSEDSECEAEIN